jgi:hypothetical protein
VTVALQARGIHTVGLVVGFLPVLRLRAKYFTPETETMSPAS